MAGEKKQSRDDRGETSEPRAEMTATATVQGSSGRTRRRQDRRTNSPTGQRQGGGGIGRGLDMTPSGSGAPATRRRQSIEHPGPPNRSEDVVVPPSEATLPADRPFKEQRTRRTIQLVGPPAEVDFKKKPSVAKRGVPAPPQQRNVSTETNLSLQARISPALLPPKKRFAGQQHQASRLGSSSSTGGPDEAMSPCCDCKTPTNLRVSLCDRCKRKRGRCPSCVPAPPQQRNASTETNLSLQARISSALLPPKKRFAGQQHQASRLDSSNSTGGPDEATSKCRDCKTRTHRLVALCDRCNRKRRRCPSCGPS